MKLYKICLILVMLMVLPMTAMAAKDSVATTHPRELGWEGSVARLVLGEHAYFWYDFQDTICTSFSVDTMGHDTVFTTDIFQVHFLDSSSVGPNKTFTRHNAQVFDLWVRFDTTTYCYNSAEGDTGYGKASATGDSVGFATIRAEYFLTQDDIDNDYEAWMADSTNQLSQDGNYNESPYGNWYYEVFTLPVATAGALGRWWVFPVRAPICSGIRFTIEADDGILESVIIIGRLVCEH